VPGALDEENGMSRNYGSLNNRRSGGAAWQWIVIGSIMGFACSAILVLAGLAAGVVNVGESAANLPTQTPNIVIITATAPPATATLPVTATVPPPTVALDVQAPTATPTVIATLLTLQPTLPPTVGAVGSAGGIAVNPGVNPGLNTNLGATGIGAGSVGTGAAAAGAVTPTVPAVGSTGVGAVGQPAAVSASNQRVLALASSLIPIAGGTFTMGTTVAEVAAAVEECLAGYGGDPGRCQLSDGEDAQPQHSVTISPFLIEETEVSYEQFLTFMNAAELGMGPGSHRNGCFANPCMQTRNDTETSNISFDSANYSVLPVINNLPMTNVTWYGASAYCAALGRRLPTEAEWEFAARGPNGRLYPWGDTWIPENASTSRSPLELPRNKVPVDAFPLGATPEGVLNLAGNNEEWVADWYDPRFYGQPAAGGTDPQGPVSGTEKVVRGGAWDLVPFFARAVHRRSLLPNAPTASVGFRCAADAGSAANVTGGLPGAATGPIGAAPVPAGTIDPASLGVIPGAGNEETTGGTFNSQPTLPPAPTSAATLAVPAGTIAPG
jgi:formylglycine-generating enzyme required for sulfatase activity